MFSIHDIVIPLPGSDVLLPDNVIPEKFIILMVFLKNMLNVVFKMMNFSLKTQEIGRLMEKYLGYDGGGISNQNSVFGT